MKTHLLLFAVHAPDHGSPCMILGSSIEGSDAKLCSDTGSGTCLIC